eukprot:3482196-Heterocapsa_arctica.AAC.1
MSCYYDIKNAFPSVARWRLDQVIDEVARPPDRYFLKARHQQALMMIPSSISGDSDSLLCIEPRSGDLQGDPSAAQKYILAMDPAIARLVESSMTFREERLLHFQLPG